MVGTLALPKRPEGKKLHASEFEPLVLQPATPSKPINLHGRLITGLKARMNNEVVLCSLAPKVAKPITLPKASTL